MLAKITKAVFPVAGLGTRFLPATKANPKEMLTVVDKPLIQYAVEEAIAAGITELIFVTSSSKRAIEDHFDSNFELETALSARGKNELLQMVKNILPDHVSCAYIRQKSPLGLGHAVLCAKQLIGDEAFAVLLADDLIDATPSCLQQMVKFFEVTRSNIVAVQEIKAEESRRYGVIQIEKNFEPGFCLSGILEKPNPDQAPSSFGVVGRYILTPKIFAELEKIQSGVLNEIQLTDGIASILKSEPVYALPFSGRRYDCGDKLGYLEATVCYALKHPELASGFQPILKKWAN